MNISTFSTIKHLPPARSTSTLAPERDSDNVRMMWKKITEITDVCNKLSQNNNQLSREIKRLGERHVLDLDLFPFKIYNLPNIFINNSAPGPNDWRTFYVRGGYVFSNYITTASFVKGTDGFQSLAYGNNVSSSNAIVLPVSQSQHYFWVEQSGSLTPFSSSYYLRHSNSPATPDTASNPNGWIGFPSSSANHWLIGWVDTNSSQSINQAFVRQVLTTDITTPPSFNANICQPGAAPKVYSVYGYLSGSLY